VAIIHRASITPTKAELIAAWLPTRAWSGGAGTVDLLGAYRFDDPAGEVGIEAHLARTERGDVLHIPLTYRAAPLDGADRHLVGTMVHSHLGRRWVYDGCADPVCVAALVTAIRTGGREAEEWVHADGAPVRRESTAYVTGSGAPGAEVPDVGVVAPIDGPAATDVGDLVVLRVIGKGSGAADGETLTGTWVGQDEPVILAHLGGGAGQRER
jgi:hypothetical protein